MKVFITNKLSGVKEEYTKPAYTKRDSIYGFISVSKDKVHFFWADGDVICCDMLDDYIVEYVL